ncbi:MAG TPA: hypothetical protein VH352_08605 [Pseudonocardiaceae bacterium]|nr:hypothetical protein [Pseudonocardiaceae bacterium]
MAVLVPATLRRSLVVSYIHGESDQDRPVRAGTLLPHGCAGDMVFAAGARGLPVPACYSETEWARLVGRACDQGIAFDHQYISPTVTCVAAPVRTPSGKIVAAVGAAVVDRRRLAAIANGARRTAEVIGANLARLPATHRALSPCLDDLTFSGTPSRRNGQ